MKDQALTVVETAPVNFQEIIFTLTNIVLKTTVTDVYKPSFTRYLIRKWNNGTATFFSFPSKYSEDYQVVLLKHGIGRDIY